MRALDARTIPVWDRAVRLLHWSLVASVAAAWITIDLPPAWHEAVGYAALAIVAARVAWGFAGPRRARFADFVRSPATLVRYLGHVVRAREARYVGHNPAGGWMVVLLLACVAAASVTGWMFTLDRFWGEPWLSTLHELLAWTVVALAAVHVAGVVFTSVRHRENLVAAMLHGRKRPAARDDVA